MTRDELRRLFLRERRRFAAKYPRLATTDLVLDMGTPPTARAGAYCIPGDGAVFFYARTLRWSRGRIVALVRHELAHCARPSNGERATDALAERVCGQAIWYDRGDVQTVTPGRGARRTRPAYLPP